jgi:excisionase family DNA binding protein
VHARPQPSRPPESAIPDQTSSRTRTTDPQLELLTITEAAELLRAPVATLRYWRHLGTGPRSFRLGRRVLYRRDDLHAWIDAQHGQNTADQP